MKADSEHLHLVNILFGWVSGQINNECGKYSCPHSHLMIKTPTWWSPEKICEQNLNWRIQAHINQIEAFILDGGSKMYKQWIWKICSWVPCAELGSADNRFNKKLMKRLVFQTIFWQVLLGIKFTKEQQQFREEDIIEQI